MKGYTLIELLLSISLISFLIAVSLPIYNTFQYKSQLDVSTNLTVRAVRTAQINSRSNLNNTQWGVRWTSNNITLFSGSTYAARDTNNDILYTLTGNAAFTTTGEFTFSKIIAKPSATNTITVSAQTRTKQISINSNGGITY